MFKKSNKKNQKGFTLVELLVVIAIIGILAVVAVPSLFSQIEKSKAADITSTIDIIKTASTAYYADKEDAPANIAALVDGKYLDGNPDKKSDKVKYTLTGDTTNKTAKLTVKITKGHMTSGSLIKLGNDLGVEMPGNEGKVDGTVDNSFEINIIDHIQP